MSIRGLWNWTIGVVLAVVVVAAFLASSVVIRSQARETERIITQMQIVSEAETRTIVRASVFAITCAAAVPVEERTADFVADCVERAFEP